MSTRTSPPTGYLPAPAVRTMLRTITDADVLYVAFPRVQHALVVDFRQNAHDAATILLATYEDTPDRQVAVVEALRPGFPTIARFVSVPWDGSTRACIEQGVFPAILNHLPAEGIDTAMAVLEQIRAAERGLGSGAAGEGEPERDNGR